MVALRPAAILVVEDDPRAREPFVRALRRAGHEVLEAGDGRQALALWARHRIDVLVTDIYLPEVDGYELVRALRQQRPDLPVLVISGGSDLGLGSTLALELAGRLGASRTLAKPVDLRELVSVVQELLDAAPRLEGPTDP
jgi:CheY-like chemotaxis protein